ncbi:MAG: hypothetical protein ACSLFH_16650, partial [Desulfuromonadales bacterium]
VTAEELEKRINTRQATIILDIRSAQPEVFDLETSNFSQGQGNQEFERRRSPLRRTIKCRDCGKGPFPDEN